MVTPIKREHIHIGSITQLLTPTDRLCYKGFRKGRRISYSLGVRILASVYPLPPLALIS